MPRRNDLLEIGKMVATHFRRFWGLTQPAEIIQQAGFTLTDEPGKPMLVIGYPDCFVDEMAERIAMYYAKKAATPAPEVNPPVEKPKVIKSDTDTKRKRIPVKPGTIKAWSAKPQNE
jgi:hypothetical protein